MKILCGSLNRKHNGRRSQASFLLVLTGMQFRSLRFGTQQWANIDSILSVSLYRVHFILSTAEQQTHQPALNYLFIDGINACCSSRNDFKWYLCPCGIISLLCTQVTYRIHPSSCRATQTIISVNSIVSLPIESNRNNIKNQSCSIRVSLRAKFYFWIYLQKGRFSLLGTVALLCSLVNANDTQATIAIFHHPLSACLSVCLALCAECRQKFHRDKYRNNRQICPSIRPAVSEGVCFCIQSVGHHHPPGPFQSFPILFKGII